MAEALRQEWEAWFCRLGGHSKFIVPFKFGLLKLYINNLILTYIFMLFIALYHFFHTRYHGISFKPKTIK